MKGYLHMKKSMVDYMKEMVSGDFSTLECIISTQYKKFLQFYKLMELHEDSVDKIKYSFNNPLTLDVLLILNKKKNAKTLKKELEDSIIENEYNACVEVKEKNIYISIELDEKSDASN